MTKSYRPDLAYHVAMPMTPAIQAVKKAKLPHVVHEYEHDPSAESYGEEAAVKLGVPFERIFKTLVVADPAGKLAVGVVPVAGRLDLKGLAKAVGVKSVTMADPVKVERTTGYVMGGVSPLAQKRALPTVIHATAEHFETIYVSAGRRGLQIELAPGDLAKLARGKFAEIARD